MIEWFKRLFHHHAWDVVDKYDMMDRGRQVGIRYVLQCKVCGCIKKKDID